MLKGVVNLLVDHLLVDVGIRMVAESAAAFYWKAHHAVAQDGDFVARVGIGAVGHFTLTVEDARQGLGLFVARFAGGKHH